MSAATKLALRQQIIAQIERCAEIAYAAGHHFAQHEKHAPSSMMKQAIADVSHVMEEYLGEHITKLALDRMRNKAASVSASAAINSAK